MAKYFGSIVKTGRVGGSVFAVQNGMTIERQYQPIVTNPRTDAQLRQRARMNTAGRFSHLCPKALIKAMQTENNRMNRSLFNKGLIDNTTASVTAGGTYTASMDAASVKFSRGAGYLKASMSTAFAVANGEATIGLTLQDAAYANKYAERIICAVLNSDSQKGPVEVVMYQDVAFANTTPISVKFDLPATIAANQRVMMWRIPIDLTEEGVNIVTNVLAGTSNDITATLAATNGLVKEFGQTIYVGEINFQAA